MLTVSALCLAMAVYYEARSESRDAQMAVAEVILNRVKIKGRRHMTASSLFIAMASLSVCWKLKHGTLLKSFHLMLWKTVTGWV